MINIFVKFKREKSIFYYKEISEATSELKRDIKIE